MPKAHYGIYRGLPGMKRWSVTMFLKLKAEHGTVYAIAATGDGDIQLGRYQHADTLNQPLGYLGAMERFPVEGPFCMERVYDDLDDEGSPWRPLEDGVSLGEIMDGFDQRLIKVSFSTTAKRLVYEWGLVEEEAEEPDFEDEVDEMAEYMQGVLEEECDCYLIEFEVDDNRFRRTKRLLKVRVRWGPDEFAACPDEYIAVRPEQRVSDVLMSVCHMAGIQYWGPHHAVLLQDMQGTKIRTYQYLNQWFAEDWTKASFHAYIRRREHQ